MTIQHLPAQTRLDDLTAVLKEDGCLVLEGLFPDEKIDEVAGEIDAYLRRTPCGDADFFGHKTTRMGGIVRKSPSSHDLIMHPKILGIMDAILGPSCDRIQLNLTQAIQIQSDERQQIFHRDDEFYPIEKHGAEFMINAMWALDDFTVENGATRIVVGSHRGEIDREPAEEDIEAAVMRRGSVLVYLGSAVHCGGPNVAETPRTGLAISYCLGWLRQAENQYLAVPPEIARTLPETLRDLLGYTIHRPNLGWYEGRDPSVVFDRDMPETLAARDYFSPDVAAAIKDYYAPTDVGRLETA